MDFKVGDKVRYLKTWDASTSGFSNRPSIMIGDILEIVKTEVRSGFMTLRSATGFSHEGWRMEPDWHEIVREAPLTQEELNRAVPLPSIDELGKFLGM